MEYVHQILSIVSVEWLYYHWLVHGIFEERSWVRVLVYALALTHVTIAAVTIYLHRSQAHKAVTLHPVIAHFFRFWLWLTTGMKTKEWVAIHRKHHAKCETKEDPHSPQTRGIGQVLLTGAELYRAEAKIQETLDKYGHHTPDDWLEWNLYAREKLGVSLMFLINIVLFGPFVGAAIGAVQMLWIPVTAAGIINGLGHWWGYRNFEPSDRSHNISPWGFLIGGEELHNNHHTYPTSAKLSVKPWEFDIGWVYIRFMEMLGLATVRKVPPTLTYVWETQGWRETLQTIITLRFELLAQFDILASTPYREPIDWAGYRASFVALWAPSDLPETALLEQLERWQHGALSSRSIRLANFALNLRRVRVG